MAKKSAEAIIVEPVAEQPTQIVEETSENRFPLTQRATAAGPAEPEEQAPPEISDEDFQGDEGEDEEDEAQARDEQGRFQPKKGAQGRIMELARERNEYRQRVDRMEQMLAQQQALLAKQLGIETGPQAPTNPNAPPDPDRFPAGRFDPDYIQATVRYEANQLFEQRIQQEQHRQVQARLIENERAFAKEHPDYLQAKEVLLMDREVAEHPGISQAVVESSRPAELIYYLGTNPEVTAQLARMSPIQVARYMGMVEAALEAQASQPKPVQTSGLAAPAAPIKPITGQQPAGIKRPGGGQQLSYAEHVAYMARLEKEARRT